MGNSNPICPYCDYPIDIYEHSLFSLNNDDKMMTMKTGTDFTK
jgi:hypothetical protein